MLSKPQRDAFCAPQVIANFNDQLVRILLGTPQSEPQTFKSYLEDIEHTSLKTPAFLNSSETKEDTFLYVASHPLLVYCMVRRFSEDLPRVLQKLDASVTSDIYKYAEELGVTAFPGSQDMQDALDIIKRIQLGSDMKTSEVVLCIRKKCLNKRTIYFKPEINIFFCELNLKVCTRKAGEYCNRNKCEFLSCT